ncbi:MAG: hypothetical protein ABIQ73_13355 [Acidimicrobiales bacterium]
MGLRFAPGQAPAALGVPAYGLVDDVVELRAIVGDARARRLGERVAEARDPGRILEAAFVDHVASRDDTLRAPVVEALRAGSVMDTVAGSAGLSVRQLHRRSRYWFGYGP